MKVLFLTPYPFDSAGSQRFRFEQYFDLLRENDIQYAQKPFINQSTWEILYAKGNYPRKVFGILLGFVRRCFQLFSAMCYDYVFIHREASPIGPPIFEWLLVKVINKKVIYDFDDAIWLPNTSESNWLISGIKWHGKVKSICRWSYKVSAGNKFLCDFAKQYNNNVQLNPTTIDTVNYHDKIKDQDTEKVVIGWTGTHSTIKYLDLIIPLISRLQASFDFEFLIISDKEPKIFHPFTFIQWNKSTEVKDLLRLNIGIMPLKDDDWAKGKCGFKALQYMSLGIPPVASPVGTNTEIIDHQENGFLCKNDGEWEKALATLINDVALRSEMGKQARKKVEDNYSVAANSADFLSLFA